MSTKECDILARKYLKILGEGSLLPVPTRDNKPLMLIGDDWFWGVPDSYSVHDCDAEDALNACRMHVILWLVENDMCLCYDEGSLQYEVSNFLFVDDPKRIFTSDQNLDDCLIEAVKVIKK